MKIIKKKLGSVTFDNLKVPGQLIVKEFPTSQASVPDIERYLRKIEELKGIKFKIVIVDYINYEHTWIKELNEALAGIKTIFVGIQAPLEIIEEREKNRNTSPRGHARSHFDVVHKNIHYDLEIDSLV